MSKASLHGMPFQTERWSDSDPKIMGPEPVFTKMPTSVEFGKGLNWYNYFFDVEAAKSFTVTYMTNNNYASTDIKKIQSLKNFPFLSVGWVLRILSNDGLVPEDSKKRVFEILNQMLTVKDVPVAETTEPVVKPKKKDLEIIGLFDDELDNFYTDGYLAKGFNALEFLKKYEVPKSLSKKIIDFYTPLLKEVTEASKVKTEGYDLTPVQFKNYIAFLKSIIDAATQYGVETPTIKKPRKPRKLKVKSPDKLVSKVKIKVEDPEFKVKSVPTTGIIGAAQVWVFNTKYRVLTKYIAETDKGLTIKGTTILGFSPTLSGSKRIRKPLEVLPLVLNSGKVALRKILDDIKTTPIEPTGRLNEDIVILRVLKD